MDECTLCNTDTFHAELRAGTHRLYLTRCWTCRGAPLMVVATEHRDEFLPAERSLIEDLFTEVRFKMRSMPWHAHAHVVWTRSLDHRLMWDRVRLLQV